MKIHKLNNVKMVLTSGHPNSKAHAYENGSTQSLCRNHYTNPEHYDAIDIHSKHQPEFQGLCKSCSKKIDWSA